MINKIEALRIRVTGIVQGVGFRPFVYRIGNLYSLKGYVVNLGGSEVEIWIERKNNGLRNFLKDLLNKKPPSARIDSIKVENMSPKGLRNFKILKSKGDIRDVSQIPPDFKIM